MIPSDRFFYRGKLHKDVFINGKTHKEAKMVVDGNPEVVWKKTIYGDKQRWISAGVQNKDQTTTKSMDIYAYVVEPTFKKSKQVLVDHVYYDGWNWPSLTFQSIAVHCSKVDNRVYIRHGWFTDTERPNEARTVHYSIYVSDDLGETWRALVKDSYLANPNITYFDSGWHHLTLSDNGFFLAGRSFTYANDTPIAHDFINYYKYNSDRTGIEKVNVLFENRHNGRMNQAERDTDSFIFTINHVSAASYFKPPASISGDIFPIYIRHFVNSDKAFQEYVPRIYNPNGYITVNSYSDLGWNDSITTLSYPNGNKDYYRAWNITENELHLVLFWMNPGYTQYDIIIPLSELKNTNHTETMVLISELDWVRGQAAIDTYIDPVTNIEKGVITYAFRVRNTDYYRQLTFDNIEDIKTGTFVEKLQIATEASIANKKADGTTAFASVPRTGGNICYEPYYRAIIGSNKRVGFYNNFFITYNGLTLNKISTAYEIGGTYA